MDSAGAAIAALVVAIGLLAGAGVVHYATANSGDEYTYSETFDPGNNQTQVTFNESNRDGVYYASTVNVTDENGTVMRPGVDYEWHVSNGTLTVLDGGSLDGDQSGQIEYSLRVPSSQQKSYASLLGGWINATYAIPLVFAVVMVIGGASLLSNLT